MSVSPRPYEIPDWAKSLHLEPNARVPLARLDAPIEPWTLPGAPGGFRLSIKRDDLTGIGFSGNKIRKLEFLVADAIERGCDTLLTCGGLQSNHCRATALAAARVGLQSVLFLRTPDPDAGPGADGNVLLDRLAGAEIRLITPEQYRDRHRLMQQAADELTNAGRMPYVIPEGGSNGLGSWGYIAATQELLQQDAASVTDIVVAVGSGGTTAGLAAGLALSGSAIRLHAVNVCDDPAYFHAEINRIYDELGLDLRSEDTVRIIDGYVGRGYALSRPEELAFIRETARTTGILLDPVYSGKAAFGLVHEIKTRPDPFAGQQILFIHTGGVFGLFATPDLLEEE